MNVKKTIKQIVALGSGLTMIGATIMGATADLGTYPADYIDEAGVFAGKIVVGANAATEDVLGAIDIAASLQAEAKTAATSCGTGSSVTVAGGVQVEGDGTEEYLALGEATGDAFDDDDLPTVLADGTISDEDGDDAAGDDMASDEWDYEQDLTMGAVVVAWDEPEDLDEPVVYLDSTPDQTYTLAIEFDDTADFTALLDGETVNWGGKVFTVGTDTTADTLYLFGSDTTTYLELQKPVVIEQDGEEYTVEIVGAQSEDDEDTVIIDVDGVRKSLEEGETNTINGLDIYIKNLFVTNIPTLDASANVFVGSNEYQISDGEVKVNDEVLDGYDVTLDGTFDALDGIDFVFDMADVSDDNGYDDEDHYLLVGDSFVDPLFGTFEVQFASMSLDEMDDAKIPFSVHGGTSDVLSFDFVNEDGDELSFEYQEDGLVHEDFIETLGAGLLKNQYFINVEGDVTSVFEITSIDGGDEQVTIKNLGTGKEKVYDEGDAVDGTDDVTVTDVVNADPDTVELAGTDVLELVLKGLSTVTLNGEDNITFLEVVGEVGEATDVTAETLVLDITYTTADGYVLTENAASDIATNDMENDDTVYYSTFGTYVVIDEDGNDAYFYVPHESEVEYNVFIAPVGASAVVVSGDSDAYMVNPIGVGIGVLDKDATLGSTPMIVVGGPCANTVAAELMGNQVDCAAGFEEGKALIQFFDEHNAILVAGYSAMDTVGASRVLADYADWELTGSIVEVVVPSLSSISVNAMG